MCLCVRGGGVSVCASVCQGRQQVSFFWRRTERTLDFATWHASAGEWRLKVCSKLKCSDSGGPWPKKGVFLGFRQGGGRRGWLLRKEGAGNDMLLHSHEGCTLLCTFHIKNFYPQASPHTHTHKHYFLKALQKISSQRVKILIFNCTYAHI